MLSFDELQLLKAEQHINKNLKESIIEDRKKEISKKRIENLFSRNQDMGNEK